MQNNYHVTFGSDAADDGFYLEYRDRPDNPFAFLTLWIEDDGNLTAAVGGGEGAHQLPVGELLEMIGLATARLKSAKSDWDAARQQYDIE